MKPEQVLTYFLQQLPLGSYTVSKEEFNKQYDKVSIGDKIYWISILTERKEEKHENSQIITNT